MSKIFKVLGIEYGGHDTSATLMINGKIEAACEQERFDLKKHSRAFPKDAIQECLKIAGVKIDDLDEISFGGDYIDMIRKVYLKPALEKKERIEFLINDIERIKKFFNFEQIIRNETNYKGQINFYRHHLCHLASTYFPSGFNNSLIVSYDGMGEIETGMIGIGDKGRIKIIDDVNRYPHSLGLIYSALTFYLGWKHHCDEGIIMGLAPFGDYNAEVPNKKKTYLQFFEEIVLEKGPLNYQIDLSWIEYHKKRDTWISSKFEKTFGKKRNYDEDITNHHKNIAAALQKRLEDVVLNQLKWLKKKFNKNQLCISGGVGLNCSLNGKIEKSRIFEEIFVQPASGDAGISLGSAYLATSKFYNYNMLPKKNHNFYLGSRASEDEINIAIKSSKVSYKKLKSVEKETAKFLSEGKIIAWFQGATEFGPRALGNRSILSRPFPESQRDFINNRVKFREAFRPFAPAVLSEFSQEYFTLNQESPHMLIASQVTEEKKNIIPAVVHIDNSCRVQTVREQNNQRFYNLIKEFYKITKCPVLLNTSFNVKGQPIVNKPDQAIKCFLSTKIDILVMENYIITK